MLKLRIILGILVLLLGAALVLGLLPGSGPDERNPDPATLNVSCAALASVREALKSGDREELLRALTRAENQAEKALEVGGIRFGLAEKTALRLAADPRPDSRAWRRQTETALERVSDVCRDEGPIGSRPLRLQPASSPAPGGHTFAA